MRSFEAIDAELSALAVHEGAVARALASIGEMRGKSLGDVDAALASLADASMTRPTPASLDADALFEDVRMSRPSILAPMSMDGPSEPVPDLAPSAAGDLAGLLEGSNSLMPPPLDETLVPGQMPVPSGVPLDDDYDDVQLASEEIEGPPSTEIEILED